MSTSKYIANSETYHGACLTCISQYHYGLERCNGCQFKKPNWNLPDLSVTEPEPLFNRNGILVYHGACLGCKRQKREGIKGCISCQYQRPNWDLPDLRIPKS